MYTASSCSVLAYTGGGGGGGREVIMTQVLHGIHNILILSILCIIFLFVDHALACARAHTHTQHIIYNILHAIYYIYVICQCIQLLMS